MPRALSGSFVGLVWNDAAEHKLSTVMKANPRAGIAHIASFFRVSVSTMRGFLIEHPEAMEVIDLARAEGDNLISIKNFSEAMSGNNKAIEREMKKRGMIGNDLVPVMPREQERDYSRLTVEELEQLALIDAKTRPDAAPEAAFREIAPPLHQ